MEVTLFGYTLSIHKTNDLRAALEVIRSQFLRDGNRIGAVKTIRSLCIEKFPAAPYSTLKGALELTKEWVPMPEYGERY